MTVTALQRSTHPIQPVVVAPAPTEPPPPCRLTESAVGAVRYRHRPRLRRAPAALPAPSRGELRLTHRGRLAVTAAVLAAVVGPTAWAVTSPGGEAGGPVPLAPAGGGQSIVVAPGDTLWRIALRSDPRADPRVTIARLVALNKLDGPTLRPGQRLDLPLRR